MPDAPIATTPYLGLGEWAEGANPGFEALNENWVLIDTELSRLNDLCAAIPTIQTDVTALQTAVTALQGDMTAAQSDITALEAAVTSLTSALAGKVDSTDPRLTVVTALHDGLAPQLDGDPGHYFAGDGNYKPVNTGRGWQISGILSTTANIDITRWTALGNESYTFLDCTLEDAPTGGDVVIDIVKTHLGVDSTVATITVSAGTKYAQIVVAVSLVAGDQVKPVMAGVGSINAGTTAYVRLRP